eukprot:scaffold142569_cov31-Tisochrysis_lutea.AAC.1
MGGASGCTLHLLGGRQGSRVGSGVKHTSTLHIAVQVPGAGARSPLATGRCAPRTQDKTQRHDRQRCDDCIRKTFHVSACAFGARAIT